jgi:hypothetical protein
MGVKLVALRPGPEERLGEDQEIGRRDIFPHPAPGHQPGIRPGEEGIEPDDPDRRLQRQQYPHRGEEQTFTRPPGEEAVEENRRRQAEERKEDRGVTDETGTLAGEGQEEGEDEGEEQPLGEPGPVSPPPAVTRPQQGEDFQRQAQSPAEGEEGVVKPAPRGVDLREERKPAEELAG